jgi:hypothetical protein
MLLTSAQQTLLNETALLLERQQTYPLQPTAVSNDRIINLLASGVREIEDLGLYMRSLFVRGYDDGYLRSERTVFPAFVHYLAATWFDELYSKFQSEFDTSSPGFPQEYEERFRQYWHADALVVSQFDILMRRLNLPLPPIGAPISSSKDMTIIVHGTWAATQTWWRQGSNNFWDFVNGRVRNLYGGPGCFRWSGNNSHAARVSAAKALLRWTQQQSYNNLDVVAHSHGGNVCLLATRAGLKINRLFLLGTPIRTEYLPDLRNVREVHNIFSTHDHIQTPAGTLPNRRGEGRTLGDSRLVVNYRATDDGNGNQGTSGLSAVVF